MVDDLSLWDVEPMRGLFAKKAEGGVLALGDEEINGSVLHARLRVCVGLHSLSVCTRPILFRVLDVGLR